MDEESGRRRRAVARSGAFDARRMRWLGSLSLRRARERDAVAVGTALATNATLTVLELSGNRTVRDECARAIGEALATNATLTSLSLTGPFGDEGAAAIGAGLARNATLTDLHLWGHQLGDAGAAAIGTALATNATLTSLSLYGPFGDEGAAALGAGVVRNTSLTSLTLGDSDSDSSDLDGPYATAHERVCAAAVQRNRELPGQWVGVARALRKSTCGHVQRAAAAVGETALRRLVFRFFLPAAGQCAYSRSVPD